MLTELQTAEFFATSAYLKAITMFRLITSGAAIVCMTLLEINKNKFAAHKSIKTLMSLHGFWTLLLNPADLLMTPEHCLIRIIPQFLGICGSVTSLLVMSAERYQASKKYSTYESSTRKDGAKFVIVHIVLTLILVYLQQCTYGFPSRVPHCSVGSVLGKPLQTLVVAILFWSELFTIYFYKSLLKRNESIQCSDDSLNMSLSERYQLSENIRMLRLLLPIVISHTSITMAGAIAYFYWIVAGFEEELYPIFEDTISMVYLQGIAMPLIFYFRYRSKRLMEQQIFTTNLSSGEELIVVYDRAITKGW